LLLTSTVYLYGTFLYICLLVLQTCVPKFSACSRLSHVDQASVCQFCLQFGGNIGQPVDYGSVGNNRPIFPIVNQYFLQVFETFDGLATVCPAAQMNGVTAAIFAPLDVIADNLAGSSVNCECCRKAKIMQKKFFRKKSRRNLFIFKELLHLRKRGKVSPAKNFSFSAAIFCHPQRNFAAHDEISLSIAKHTATNMPE